MPIINYTAREVQLKIVLHGPPSSGRAATMVKLHSCNEGRASLSGLAIPAKEPGKTLAFSFLADTPNSFGFATRFEFHALSGPLSSERSLQLLLRDADGIILVADSQWEKLEDNVKSLQEIEENLKKEDAALDEMPYVLQYNKRDLPDIAPTNYVDFLLNNRPRRSSRRLRPPGRICRRCRKLSWNVLSHDWRRVTRKSRSLRRKARAAGDVRIQAHGRLDGWSGLVASDVGRAGGNLYGLDVLLRVPFGDARGDYRRGRDDDLHGRHRNRALPVVHLHHEAQPWDCGSCYSMTHIACHHMDNQRY